MKTKTTITRTVHVEFEADAVREILREKCGAPPTAVVEINDDMSGPSTVTWSTKEEQK